MAEIRVVSKERYPMILTKPNPTLGYYEWEHRLTLEHNGRYFILIFSTKEKTAQLKEIVSNKEAIGLGEITTRSLAPVKDNLFIDQVVDLAQAIGALNLEKPMIKPLREFW